MLVIGLHENQWYSELWGGGGGVTLTIMTSMQNHLYSRNASEIKCAGKKI